MQLLFPVILFAAMYFMLIRPQQQRARQHRALVAALEVGDEIVTVGGLVGTIVDIVGDRIGVEVSPGVRVVFLRPAVSQRVRDFDGPGDDLTLDEGI